MAIAYRAGTTAGGGSGGNLAVNKPTGTADNDIIIVAFYREGATLTLPAGWGLLLEQRDYGSDNMYLTVAWKRAASEPASWTFQLNATTWRIAACGAFSGCLTSGTPYEAATGWNGNFTLSDISFASITTTVADTMRVVCTGDYNGNDQGVGATGLTQGAQLTGTEIFYAPKATTGATGTGTFTGGAYGGGWASIHFALKPDTGGGGPTHTLDAVTGSYAITGQDATLQVARKLTAETGSYTVSGQTASLLAGRKLTADAGSYTVTGQDANLLTARKLVADTGAYTLSGQDAGLIASRRLTAESGSYELTGQAANLLVSRLLSAESGAYTLTGQDVTLVYTPLGGPDYTLVAESGSYALSGQAVSLIVSRVLTAESGAYVLTGQDAQLLVGHLLAAESGSYTVSGQAATLLVSRLLTAASGSYTINGQAVTLVYSGTVAPVTPDSRVYVIPAEDRVYVVVAEDRVFAIQ